MNQFDTNVLAKSIYLFVSTNLFKKRQCLCIECMPAKPRATLIIIMFHFDIMAEPIEGRNDLIGFLYTKIKCYVVRVWLSIFFFLLLVGWGTIENICNDCIQSTMCT